MISKPPSPGLPGGRLRDLSLFEEGAPAFYRQRLLALLRAHSYERREVVLSSGRTSDFYIDCKQTLLLAEGHFLCGFLVQHVLAQVARDVTAVGGLTMGADPIASAASSLSFLSGRPLDAFYIRKEPKGHGTRRFIEGDRGVPPGTPVAIVEDVLTTGASTLLAVGRAREHGLIVRHVVVVCDRQEGGREAVEASVPMTALCHREEFSG